MDTHDHLLAMYLKYLVSGSIFLAWSTIACGHAGSLDEYPERFPGKSLQAIVREWEPAPENTWDEADLSQAVWSLAIRWLELPVDDLKKQVALVLEENRRGAYRKRFANVLHDMEDLLASGQDGHSAEAADYLRWRVDHMESDDGFFEHQPVGAWNESPQQKEERTRQWQSERWKEISSISIKADTASAALRPHWLVQCGALEFRHRRYLQAAAFFERVCEAFPNHPRAEVAVLMLARMKFDEWTNLRPSWEVKPSEVSRLDEQAWAAFDRYHRLYPEGRFAADLKGWEGGIALKKGDVRGALSNFLSQAQTPGHPEIRRRAFQQIEWLLKDLIKDPSHLGTLSWEEIAAEPYVALRLGYFMLDCHSELDLEAIMHRRSGGDHRVLETLTPELAAVRAAARPAWALLDEALAKNHLKYRGKHSVISDVLHGWSAIMAGIPGVVPVMVKQQTQGPGTDDVLWVRALAKLKMGLCAEGIRGLDELDRLCPDSPLRRGGNLRRVDAWLELHQPAAAIALIGDVFAREIMTEIKQEVDDSAPLQLPGEWDQRLSALLTFAPLAELEKASLSAGLPAPMRTMLRGSLRVRYLSEERFAESMRFAEVADFESWNPPRRFSDSTPEVLAREWRDSVSTLQTLSEVVRQASNESKVAAWLSLGSAWEQRLWHLFDGGVVYMGAGGRYMALPAASNELRHHARILGLGDATAATILDQRQEMTHAIRCYKEALQLSPKGSASSLKALLALQDALRTCAEYSPYWMDRTVETNAAAQSRMLHGRILAEHAGTDAARQAVWWTFQPAHTLSEWQPGQTRLFRCEFELAALLAQAETKTEWDDWQTRKSIERLTEQLKALLSNEPDTEKQRTTIASLRRAVQREAPVASAGLLLNHLDDLDLLLKKPEVTAEARKAYFEARLSGNVLDASAAMFAPIQDFVVFWNAAITPSTTALTSAERKLMAEPPGRGERQRIAQAQVCRMQEFLIRFPQSVKREAALARLAINTLRQFRCHCGMVRFNEFEDATTAYGGFEIERGALFDATAVMAALDAYDSEFPEGRYHWDVLLIRGIAKAEMQDWSAALKHLIAVLDNPQKPDLHVDASNNLCAIYMELLNSQQRPGIMEAIKSTPGAWQKLDLFLHSPTCGWRLRVLKDWLTKDAEAKTGARCGP